MAQAPHDKNGNPTLLATSNADGSTQIALKADPTTHRVSTDDNNTGSNLSATTNAKRDQNGVTVLLAVSSSDGVTPVPIYITAAGVLLTQST